MRRTARNTGFAVSCGDSLGIRQQYPYWAKESKIGLFYITTDPNKLIEPLHNRMPVFLQPKDYDPWLTPGDQQRPPVDLLRPFPAEQMTAWKVDCKVGNVKNGTPDCIEPTST